MSSLPIPLPIEPLRTADLASSQGIDSPTPVSSKVQSAIEQVLAAKIENRRKKLSTYWSVSNLTMIFGDLFCTASLGLQGAISLSPAIASIAGVALTNVGCGIIGGAINIGVAGVCLNEAIQCFKNGDVKKGAQLAADTVGLAILGAIMILSSLAVIVGALGGVGAFITSNPWILPVIFFLLTLPTMIDVSRRVIAIWSKKDVASQINSKEIEQKLKQDEIDWGHSLLSCSGSHPFNLTQIKASESSSLKLLSEKMEILQADMGVDAAIEAFRLMKALNNHDKKAALKALKAFNKFKKSWYLAQHVRLVQQLFFSGSFVASMVGACGSFSHRTVELITAGQNFGLSMANLIPLYMDTFWPFKRNVPMVVPKMELDEPISMEPGENTALLRKFKAEHAS
jgi:hypothetical protein